MVDSIKGSDAAFHTTDFPSSFFDIDKCTDKNLKSGSGKLEPLGTQPTGDDEETPNSGDKKKQTNVAFVSSIGKETHNNLKLEASINTILNQTKRYFFLGIPDIRGRLVPTPPPIYNFYVQQGVRVYNEELIKAGQKPVATVDACLTRTKQISFDARSAQSGEEVPAILSSGATATALSYGITSADVPLFRLNFPKNLTYLFVDKGGQPVATDASYSEALPREMSMADGNACVARHECAPLTFDDRGHSRPVVAPQGEIGVMKAIFSADGTTNNDLLIAVSQEGEKQFTLHSGTKDAKIYAMPGTGALVSPLMKTWEDPYQEIGTMRTLAVDIPTLIQLKSTKKAEEILSILTNSGIPDDKENPGYPKHDLLAKQHFGALRTLIQAFHPFSPGQNADSGVQYALMRTLIDGVFKAMKEHTDYFVGLMDKTIDELKATENLEDSDKSVLGTLEQLKTRYTDPQERLRMAVLTPGMIRVLVQRAYREVVALKTDVAKLPRGDEKDKRYTSLGTYPDIVVALLLHAGLPKMVKDETGQEVAFIKVRATGSSYQVYVLQSQLVANKATFDVVLGKVKEGISDTKTTGGVGPPEDYNTVVTAITSLTQTADKIIGTPSPTEALDKMVESKLEKDPELAEKVKATLTRLERGEILSQTSPPNSTQWFEGNPNTPITLRTLAYLITRGIEKFGEETVKNNLTIRDRDDRGYVRFDVGVLTDVTFKNYVFHNKEVMEADTFAWGVKSVIEELSSVETGPSAEALRGTLEKFIQAYVGSKDGSGLQHINTKRQEDIGTVSTMINFGGMPAAGLIGWLTKLAFEKAGVVFGGGAKCGIGFTSALGGAGWYLGTRLTDRNAIYRRAKQLADEAKTLVDKEEKAQARLEKAGKAVPQEAKTMLSSLKETLATREKELQTAEHDKDSMTRDYVLPIASVAGIGAAAYLCRVRMTPEEAEVQRRVKEAKINAEVERRLKPGTEAPNDGGVPPPVPDLSAEFDRASQAARDVMTQARDLIRSGIGSDQERAEVRDTTRNLQGKHTELSDLMHRAIENNGVLLPEDAARFNKLAQELHVESTALSGRINFLRQPGGFVRVPGLRRSTVADGAPSFKPRATGDAARPHLSVDAGVSAHGPAAAAPLRDDGRVDSRGRVETRDRAHTHAHVRGR